MIHGIDVSSAQAVGADWAAAKASGVAYCWVKCTEGNTGRDPAYHGHLDAGSEAGVIMGAYHFARPNTGVVAVTGLGRAQALVADARTEAANLYHACNGWGSQSETLPPLLDLEAADKSLTASELLTWLGALVEETQRLFGVKPILYTGLGFTQRYGAAWDRATWLREVPLMLASYPLPPPSPTAIQSKAPPLLAPWDRVTIWQYSGGGPNLAGNTCPGFGRVPIDRSVAYVDSLDDLRVIV